MASLYDICGRANVEDYLENSEDLLEGKLELAGEVVDHARSISPEDTGDYKDGIVARRHGRAGVGVHWTAEHSNLVENGTEHTPEYAIKARTEEYFRSGL